MPPSIAELPDAAWITGLAALPDVGPARLAALVGRGAPAATFAALADGRLRADPALAAACGRDPAGLLARWRAAAADLDIADLWCRHEAAGVAVLQPHDRAWPAALVDDPDPPRILFTRGSARCGTFPAVAVVGTRRCTRYGYDTARRLGEELARAGVAVVSGLAAGIDGAAHHGALDAVDAGGAPPIGVVGTGLDQPYPRGHRRLWERVAEAGVLLGEAPLGTRPARWRFPARNRIIAALADVLVVVESAESGGAMHTVDEAIRRDRPVLAVPGPVTSHASAGTNRLLRDVAAPCCDVDDVLLLLGVSPTGSVRGRGPDGRVPPTGVAAAVLAALGWTPATLDLLVTRSGRGLGEVALALESLVVDGWIVADGPWFERVGDEQGVRR